MLFEHDQLPTNTIIITFKCQQTRVCSRQAGLELVRVSVNLPSHRTQVGAVTQIYNEGDCNSDW